MRRVFLGGSNNVLKRVLAHEGAFNIGLSAKVERLGQAEGGFRQSQKHLQLRVLSCGLVTSIWTVVDRCGLSGFNSCLNTPGSDSLSGSEKKLVLPRAVRMPALGFLGLYQAFVPAGIAPGDAVPAVLTVGGQSSPVVTMAVR